ncbi:uncharacterized protein PG998_006691 [Apiospora kogelbergensis]|uniref:uncharacterized protein n=1 Tax=Apiospora kogelbergensis TaxID=1337665 RepID=UPI00312F530C
MLLAHVYGTLYLSIALLVTDESLSWDARCALGIETVQAVLRLATYEERKAEFMLTGVALLAAFSGLVPEQLQAHDGFAVSPESQMTGELQSWVTTAPDPEVKGGTLLLCQGVFASDDEPELYVSTHGSMNNDAAEALMPPFEAFARSLEAQGGRGDWKCIYWDGKRWFNLIFLEWQTAESLGFLIE